jgi:hypothetical protein
VIWLIPAAAMSGYVGAFGSGFLLRESKIAGKKLTLILVSIKQGLTKITTSSSLFSAAKH